MSHQDRAVQQIQTRLIEEVGADAVLIVFSKTKKNATTTHIHTWGNELACKGLAEEAYDHFVPETESLPDEE
tara:strand:+ start:588 stop:803 length:216 start_codon:yes stop_codon:yes gene_type:complete